MLRSILSNCFFRLMMTKETIKIILERYNVYSLDLELTLLRHLERIAKPSLTNEPKIRKGK